MDPLNLSALIPTLIVVPFILFLGKIIIRYAPFPDDQKRVLGGAVLHIGLTVGFPGIIGSVIGLYFGAKNDLAIHLFYISVILLTTMCVFIRESAEHEKIFGRLIHPTPQEIKEEKTDKRLKFFLGPILWIMRGDGIYFFSNGIIGYVLTRELLDGLNLWTLPTFFFWTLSLIGQAALLSFEYAELPKADIIPIHPHKPIQDVQILGYDDKNLRFYQGDKLVIMNRDHIVKIETQRSRKLDDKK